MEVPIILFYFLFGGQGFNLLWFQYSSHWYFKKLEKLLLKFTGKKKPTATAKTTLRMRIMREEARGWGTTCWKAAVITPPPLHHTSRQIRTKLKA